MKNVEVTGLHPTPPAGIAPKPHKVGPLPETLASLVGAIAVRKQFIASCYSDSDEYWRCQRDLADLERRWAEAERVWADHIAKEAKR